MTLDYLLEFWMTLLDTSQGNVAVSRDIAEKTRQALSLYSRFREDLRQMHEEIEEDLG
jgi:hypothetical protein